jgi:nucleoside 2-deoxyribosyltransferase
MQSLKRINMRKKIYIAGPDVFSTEWPSIARKIMDACNQWGFEALLPIPETHSLNRPDIAGITQIGKPDDAKMVFKSCLNMIQSCDAMIANITPFRGDEPDSGTVFEIATAYALEKPIIGYTLDTRLTHERHAHNGTKTEYDALTCRAGYLVERFNLPCNVMVAQGCTNIVFGDAIAALFALKNGNLAENKQDIAS